MRRLTELKWDELMIHGLLLGSSHATFWERGILNAKEPKYSPESDLSCTLTRRLVALSTLELAASMYEARPCFTATVALYCPGQFSH